MLRDTARALIGYGSPAQRVQGMQMLFEANQPTAGEKEENERERLRGVVDNAGVDDDLKERARLGVDIGAKPEHLLEVLGFDSRGVGAQREAVKERSQKLQAHMQSQAVRAATYATIEDSERQASKYLNRWIATGTSGSLMSYIPGSAAYKLERVLEPIKAIIGFDRLQQMREESKTGGALGAVSNIELRFLQAVQGSLDIGQDASVIRNNVKAIRKSYDLFSKMRNLAPLLDIGDPEALKEYGGLVSELAQVRRGVTTRVDLRDVPQDPEGAELETKYGGGNANRR